MPTGSCLCGAISYEFTGEPLKKALCHCTDCQKWSGGAYTTNVVVPRTAFKVTKGTPKHYNIKGDSGKMNDHWFCGDCGSSLYTELEVLEQATVIKAGGLDDESLRDLKNVDVEFYCKDRLEVAKPVQGAEQNPVFG